MFQPSQSIRIRPRTFDVRDWTCIEDATHGLTFRPSGRTVVRRLAYTLMAAIWITLQTLLLARAGVGPTGPALPERLAAEQAEANTAMESLRNSIPAEDWLRIQQAAEQRSIERETRLAGAGADRTQIKTVVLYIYAANCAILAVLGLLPPLTAFWQRITVCAPRGNQIAITSSGLWTSTHRVSVDATSRLSVRAAERVFRRRHWGTLRGGYRWIVSVEPTPALALLGTTVPSLELYVHHQSDRPVEQMPIPPRVRQILDAVERMTGLESAPLLIVDFDASRRSLWRSGRYVSSGPGATFASRVPLGQPRVTTRAIALDEMTPEMRAQFDVLRARAGAGPDRTVTAEVVSDGRAITYRDASGTVHTFKSLNEMPEEIRAMFDMMRRTTNQPPG